MQPPRVYTGGPSSDLKSRGNKKSLATVCTDSTMPKTPRSKFSYPSNLLSDPGIQAIDQRPRGENLGKILCKRVGTVSSRYHKGQGEKYGHVNSQIQSPQRKKGNISSNLRSRGNKNPCPRYALIAQFQKTCEEIQLPIKFLE